MQLALLIFAGLGAVLFLVSFVAYAISGFRHHFVTGIISMLPVLNIITLPSLWYKSSRKFIVGFIGLIIFILAWLLGADQGIQNLLSRQDKPIDNASLNVATTQKNQQKPSVLNTSSVAVTPNRSLLLNEENMVDLPKIALYKMAFDTVPVNQISNLQGRVVQIIKTDSSRIEGRIKSVSPGTVVLEGLFENELPISSIKQLKLMVKKSSQ